MKETDSMHRSIRAVRIILVAAVATVTATVTATAQTLAQPATQATNQSVPEAAVLALASDRALDGAQIGVAILDVSTGHFLAASHEHTPLNPASNAKLYTVATALALLHGSHRYETTLSGKIKGDSVLGSLVLRGHGDPSLGTSELWSMVQDLKAHGVRRIEGDILIDQRFFDDLTTPPAFEQKPNEWAAFRAPVSAVAINENTVTMSVRPGNVGSPANVSFDPPGFVDVEGEVRTVANGTDAVGLELRPNGHRLTAIVSGSIPKRSRLVRYTRRVEDPRLLAGYTLRQLLEQAGIQVRKSSESVKLGNSASGEKDPIIARHSSEPLSTLLYPIGKASNNFYAEMVFKSLAGEVKPRPATSQDGAEIVSNWLTSVGVNEPGMVIKNGSGLFDANRATTASIVQLLRVAWQSPSIQPEFLAHLSIGGVDGTLHNRFRSERVRRAVRAKTGTLDDAIALSGYVLGPPESKGPLAFSIVMNGVSGKAQAARQAADKLVESLVQMVWVK